MPMPRHNDVGKEEEAPKNKPKPLISVPVLSSDNESSDSDSDAEDVMTAEEEAAARRYLSGGGQTEQRRMSSLDVYLSQPQPTAEPLIINRKRSLRGEEEEIAQLNSVDDAAERERQLMKKRDQEREAVKREREAKQVHKSEEAHSPSARRMTYRKHGFGGLSKERRKKLKELIMQKAHDELRAERLKEMQIREQHLTSVLPAFNIEGMNENQLKELLQNWHSQAKSLEAQRIDLLERIQKQDEEINELTMKLIDTKGKYPRPILRKVPKPQDVFQRLERLQALNAMHTHHANIQLKGKNAMDDDGFQPPAMVNGMPNKAIKQS